MQSTIKTLKTKKRIQSAHHRWDPNPESWAPVLMWNHPTDARMGTGLWNRNQTGPFLEMGISSHGSKWMVPIMENPTKLDDSGVYPILGNLHIRKFGSNMWSLNCFSMYTIHQYTASFVPYLFWGLQLWLWPAGQFTCVDLSSKYLEVLCLAQEIWTILHIQKTWENNC